ncbi:MAG: putative nucleotidyltransferase [Patescibacteria group bacterium]|jgi:predicted nucleotidyltransferase
MNSKKVNYEYETILQLIQRPSHGRQIAKLLNTSLTRIQKIIKVLYTENIIDYNEQGKNHIYYLKNNLKVKTYRINAENYKLHNYLGKFPDLEPMIQEISEEFPKNIIILFGSFAKNTQTKSSDIDIYIDTSRKEIKKTLESQYYQLDVKIGKFDLKSPLIQEIIKHHIIINGAEKYYAKLKGSS